MGLNMYIISCILFLSSDVIAIMVLRRIPKVVTPIIHQNKIGYEMELYTPHWIAAFTFMVVGNAHAICIFRLLPGIRTRTLKHIHAFMFLGNYVTFRWTVYHFRKFKKENIWIWRPSYVHGYSTHRICGHYLHFFAATIFVFYYMYSNQPRRRMFALFHNFFGIYLFNMTVMMALMGTIAFQLKQEYNYNYRRCSELSILILLYGMIIDAIILNPFSEWPVVGRI